MKTNGYWFQEDAATVANHLQQLHMGWDQQNTNPFFQAWIRNTIAYYSAVLDASAWETSLSFDGEQGELVKMLVPQSRSLIRQFVSLITKQRLAFQCVAQSEGADVVQETRLGNALINQIVEKEKVDQKGERLAEIAVVLGISFIKSTWRTDKGNPRAATQDPNADAEQDGQAAVLYDGDLEISVYSPYDVFFDYTIEEWENNDWVEVRTLKNRWSLIAQFPDLEDEIKSLPKARDWRTLNMFGQNQNNCDDDLVACFEAFHKPTPAIPQGRMIMYSDERTIYFDGANKYKCIPVECCKPEPVMGYGFGYPMFSNLLPAQEMLDHSFSAIATNQSAFAVQNVTVPRGAGISVQEVNGMNLIQFTPQNVPGGGKPEALQLCQSSPETFKFIDILRSNLLEMSNINSALRGQPPAGVTSGAAIATLTTNAMEFITSFSKAYSQCIERTMMHALNAYRQFASTPHLVRLVGKNFQAYNKEFVGKDLDPIQAIKITMSNPLMQTTAGRADLAEKLLGMGVVKDAQEYLSIINGDDPSALWKTELSENDLISSENEALMEGKDVVALSTDDHPRHIREHAGLLNDPAVRFNNNRVQSILEHVLEHENLAKNTDPFLMAMVRTGKMPEGGPPPPPGQMGGMPPPPGGGAPPSPDMHKGPMGLPTPGGTEGRPATHPANPAPDMLGRSA